MTFFPPPSLYYSFPPFTHFLSPIFTQLSLILTSTFTHAHTSHTTMATNSLQSLHKPLLRRHNLDTQSSSSSSIPSSLFIKPTTSTSTTSLSQKLSTHFILHSTTSSSASTTTTTTTTPATPPEPLFDLLQQHLSSKDFRQADEVTRRLLIILAGENAQKRGYVFFSEVQFISELDLQKIDSLWRQYSNDKFGYSVQKKIWQKQKKDFSRFFIKVGWMKKLDTEVEQYNYRAFPNEFIWELNDDTPEGHLPLTNALRGVQLLNSVLMHPAFQSVEADMNEEAPLEGKALLRQNPNPLSSNKIFKTDYSF